MQKDADCLSRFRDTLENALLQLEETYVNGSKEYRLPHVSNIFFKYAESEGLLMGLNKEIALSSGSACTSASIEPSYVLKALGLSNEMAHSSLRFSLGRYTTEEEVDYTVDQMVKAVKQLREMSPLWEMYKASVI
jgi:cysteine desulfurase